jgi:hypothetical protein
MISNGHKKGGRIKTQVGLRGEESWGISFWIFEGHEEAVE